MFHCQWNRLDSLDLKLQVHAHTLYIDTVLIEVHAAWWCVYLVFHCQWNRLDSLDLKLQVHIHAVAVEPSTQYCVFMF